MSMNWRDAKKWAQEDTENRDWRDGWKYGRIVRGMGCCPLNFDWGPDATDEDKTLLEDSIQSMSKWAAVVEDVLDDPPTKQERKLFKRLRKLKG